MNRTTLAALAIFTSTLALPACQDSSPVEAAAERPASALSTSAGGPTFQLRVHDDYATYSVESWSGSTYRQQGIWLARAAPGAGARASLSLHRMECTQSGPEWWEQLCSVVHGWGTIPARDVSGSFGSGLTVHTDLRGNPDFSIWGADPGVVAVQWQRTGWFESRSSGSSEWSSENLLVRQSGTSNSASAIATGELLGSPLPEGGLGMLSRGRGVMMQFERKVGS